MSEPTPQDRYHTRRFRALNFDFGFATDDSSVGRYLDRIWAHLAVEGSPAHRYELSTQRRSGRAHHVVNLDGEVVVDTKSPAVALSYLLWHVNREVVDRTSDLLLFHAAGATLDGRAVILPAPAESGKTTLVAGLVRAGFDYLTDEAVAVDPTSLLVHPYPKPLSVDQGSWPVLSELGPSDNDPAHFLSDQWHVGPQSLRPDAVSEAARVSHVVSPSYEAGARTELVPLHRAEAVLLLGQTCFNLARFGRAGFDAIGRLVAPASCHRLVVGDLDAGVQAVSELFGEPSTRLQGRLAGAGSAS